MTNDGKNIRCAINYLEELKCHTSGYAVEWLDMAIKAIKQYPKGHCRDCRWWKDSDGAYRRGVGAESQCPINRKEVYDGDGYCFLFAPQESEGE